MKYIFRELYYFTVDLFYLIRGNHTKINFRAKVVPGSKLEGYNKLSHHSYFCGELGYASYVGEESVVIGKIGRYCSIAGGVRFLTKTHPVTSFVSSHPAFYSIKKQSGFSFVDEQKFNESPKIPGSDYSIIVGNDVYIGNGATIIGPVVIGDGAVIAANATVTQDVPPYTIVGGVPAHEIKKRFSEEEIEFLCNFKWWNKEKKWIQENADKFVNIQDFLSYVESEDS